MCEARRNPKLMPILLRELHTDPAPELGRTRTQIHGNVINRALEHGDQFPLRTRILEVQTAQYAAARTRNIVLQERTGNARLRVAVGAPALPESAALIRENPRLDEQDSGERRCENLHASADRMRVAPASLGVACVARRQYTPIMIASRAGLFTCAASHRWFWAVPLALGACADRSTPVALPPPDAPCLLLITVDTLRADALGCYGNPGGHTPQMDGLAASGVLFENAVTPMATTFPAHATMFTGLYPGAHGVRWNGDSLVDEAETLAERLSAAGWETAAFVSFKAILHSGNLGQGFAVQSDAKRTSGDATRPGHETLSMARAWLEQPHDRPFFLWVHLFEPHTPLPLRPWAAAQLADYEGPFEEGCDVGQQADFNHSMRKHDGAYDADDAEAFRHIYHAAVREADALVGELLDMTTQAAGQRELLTVLVADHGEMTGDHDLLGHGSLLWEGVLHVPMIVHAPKRFVAGRRTTRVGLPDLAPTVFELLSLPAPDSLQGRSLLPLLRGEKAGEGIYYGEIRISKDPDAPQREALAGFDGMLKAVMDANGVRFYDLAQDPEEAHPMRVEAAGPSAQRLIVKMNEYRARNALTNRDSPFLDAAHRAELAALGYTE